MSGRDFIAVDRRRRSSRRRSSSSSVISTFSSKGGTSEKNQIFAVFQKNSQFFWNPRFLAKWVDEISSPSMVVVRRRRPSSPSSVISTFSSKGGTFEKNQIFAVFQKNSQFFWNPRFLAKWVDEILSPSTAVDGRRRSSPSSVVAVVRHFHFFVQGRDLSKKSNFRCFSKKLTIFLKSKIFSKMSGRDFIAVDRRRRSSPSSVVAVIRHFHFFVQGRDLWKKSNFRCFSKKLTIFLKSKIFSKMSGRDFIAVDGRRWSSSVVAVVHRRRQSVISTFSSKGGTFEKNQIFAVFQKNAQFFWNPRFLAKWVDEILSPSPVVVRHRRRPSSPSSVISTFSSKGGTFEKNQIFAVFQKNSQFFWNSRFLAKWVDEIFSPSTVIVGRRRRRSSPSSVVAVIRHFHFFVQGRDLWKKSDFRCFSKKLTIFLKSKIFSKMSGRDFFAVDRHRRSSPSSVVAVIRHFHFFVQGRDLWKKIRFSLFFKKTRNFSEIQDF